jgi:hypothetical protein
MSLRKTLRREARVAFSRNAQPVWFRVAKWIVAIGISVRFRRARYFWWYLLGALGLALTIHLIWRWQTHGWTRPWGGWDDVEAAKQN